MGPKLHRPEQTRLQKPAAAWYPCSTGCMGETYVCHVCMHVEMYMCMCVYKYLRILLSMRMYVNIYIYVYKSDEGVVTCLTAVVSWLQV